MEEQDRNEAIVKLTCESKEIIRRVELIEKSQAETRDLVISVNTLANNMQHLLEEQRSQNKRIEAIEQAPLAELKDTKSSIIKSIVTSIVAAIIGAILTLIINK